MIRVLLQVAPHGCERRLQYSWIEQEVVKSQVCPPSILAAGNEVLEFMEHLEAWSEALAL